MGTDVPLLPRAEEPSSGQTSPQCPLSVPFQGVICLPKEGLEERSPEPGSDKSLSSSPHSALLEAERTAQSLFPPLSDISSTCPVGCFED